MRYLKALRFLWTLAAHRLDADLPEGVLPPALHWLLLPFRLLRRRDGSSLARALEGRGPAFIKMGQFLSTRPDLVGRRIADGLERLTDSCKPLPARVIRAELARQLGGPLERAFAVFDDEPLASASLAQVHRAQLHDGAWVAVKVLRPRVERRLERDLRVLRVLAGWLARLPRAGALQPLEIFGQFATGVRSECDLILEAANTDIMRDHAKRRGLLHIPRVHWGLCTKRLLVTELLHPAIPANDLQAMQDAGVDVHELARRAVRIFFQQVVEDNFFHGDMHPGNVFVLPGGADGRSEPCWAAVDCAVAGSLRPNDLHLLAHMLRRVVRGDYARLAEIVERAGWVSRDLPRSELPARLRALIEPARGKPLAEVPYAETLAEILAGTRTLGVTLPPRLALLLKTVACVEGLGRRIDPELNIWEVLEPLLERRFRGPRAAVTMLRQLREVGVEISPAEMARLPERLLALTDDLVREKPPPQPAQGRGWMPWLRVAAGVALLGLGLTMLDLPLAEQPLPYALLGLGAVLLART